MNPPFNPIPLQESRVSNRVDLVCPLGTLKTPPAPASGSGVHGVKLSKKPNLRSRKNTKF